MIDQKSRRALVRSLAYRMLLGGWCGLIALTCGGCRSLLTPHQAIYQRSDCDSLGACAGYTETRWTSLDGCNWENPMTQSHTPLNEYDVDQEYTPNEESLLLGEAIRLGEAILLEEAIRADQRVSFRESLKVAEVTKLASFVSAEVQNGTNPSRNEEVQQSAETASLHSAPTTWKRDDPRQENQLVEISIEYLQ